MPEEESRAQEQEMKNGEGDGQGRPEAETAQAGDDAAGDADAGEGGGGAPEPMNLQEFPGPEGPSAPGGIDLLMDVDLDVKIELGRTEMAIEDILKLRKGSVVELDKLAGDPVDILVNDRPVARGEILVVSDNFCVRITEIIDPEAGLKSEDETDE